MTRKGIAYAGNLIVDQIRTIDRLPGRSELANIRAVRRSTGGVCNGAIGMTRLDPSLPVSVYGVVGEDAEGDFILSEFAKAGVGTGCVLRRGVTAFTDVYEETSTSCRTFFTFGGASDTFDVDDVPYDTLDQQIFHICYPLLLRALDQPDETYGTRMGRMLHAARQAGCMTSLDVVSEESDRYLTLVRPILRYADYITVNELEAARISGVQLSRADGSLIEENMKEALCRIMEMGVGRQAVIHAPAAAFGMDAQGHYAALPGKRLPEGFIGGTVGAGDAFCAGVLLAAYRSLGVEDALRYGSASAIQSLKADTANGSMTAIDEALVGYDRLPFRK